MHHSEPKYIFAAQFVIPKFSQNATSIVTLLSIFKIPNNPHPHITPETQTIYQTPKTPLQTPKNK